MSPTGTIEEVTKRLKRATSFIDIFGVLPDGTVSEQQFALRSRYAALVMMVHPDHAEPSARAQAEEAFRLLGVIRMHADEAIKKGTYSKHGIVVADLLKDVKPISNPLVMRSAAGSYLLRKDPIWSGEFSKHYRARILESDEQVVLKIARKPTDNLALENEIRILSKINGPNAHKVIASLASYAPEVRDSFVVSSGRQQFRVVVTPYRTGYRSIAEIMKMHPRGLDPRDAAWIARRVLSQVVLAKMLGVVHGAITPDHVLVHPITHDPLHIGWAHSVDRPHGRVKVIGHWDRIYPPEVRRGEEVDQRTDIYMAGMVIIRLLGGNNALPGVPPKMIELLNRCIDLDPARRPSSGRDVLDEFTRIVRDAWGTEYRPLAMPAPVTASEE